MKRITKPTAASRIATPRLPAPENRIACLTLNCAHPHASKHARAIHSDIRQIRFASDVSAGRYGSLAERSELKSATSKALSAIGRVKATKLKPSVIHPRNSTESVLVLIEDGNLRLVLSRRTSLLPFPLRFLEMTIDFLNLLSYLLRSRLRKVSLTELLQPIIGS